MENQLETKATDICHSGEMHKFPLISCSQQFCNDIKMAWKASSS